jgi:hypothetical protein
MLLRLFVVVVIVFVSGFEVMVCRRCVVRRCLQMVFARWMLLLRHESSSGGKVIEKALGWLMTVIYGQTVFGKEWLVFVIAQARFGFASTCRCAAFPPQQQNRLGIESLLVWPCDNPCATGSFHTSQAGKACSGSPLQSAQFLPDTREPTGRHQQWSATRSAYSSASPRLIAVAVRLVFRITLLFVLAWSACPLGARGDLAAHI